MMSSLSVTALLLPSPQNLRIPIPVSGDPRGMPIADPRRCGEVSLSWRWLPCGGPMEKPPGAVRAGEKRSPSGGTIPRAFTLPAPFDIASAIALSARAMEVSNCHFAVGWMGEGRQHCNLAISGKSESGMEGRARRGCAFRSFFRTWATRLRRRWSLAEACSITRRAAATRCGGKKSREGLASELELHSSSPGA